ncbi:hypothetical protein JGUZn3_18310 [Entomobacter blattae]|uniref:Uncharacterized protein n=2 Tax=Entomobacter blattae TaxID=2762277 RepID=A0A7H1NTD5_9PROT|nr:hypothetical protein JGUZn3_18310 [Entomobacter blattae]
MSPYCRFIRPAMAGFRQVICLVVIAGWMVAYFGTSKGYAQSDTDGGLQDQVSELRQQITQLQGQLASTGSSDDDDDDDHARRAGTGQILTQLLQRVSDLEQQQREMRGQLDQLTNDLQQKTELLKKQISDMNFASQHGGGEASTVAPTSGELTTEKRGEATPSSAAQHAQQDSSPAPSASPLQAAQAALSKRDYSLAQGYAEQSLSSAHTASTQAESYYLLGRAHSGMKDYGQAAVAYYHAYQKSPRSSKGQHALLGVSLAMLADGKKKEACQAAEKLKSEFPSPEANVKAALVSVKKRAGCS